MESEEPPPVERVLRKSTLREQGKERDWEGTTMEERLSAMWQLAVDAWVLKGETVSKHLDRDAFRIIRRHEDQGST
jgi:hypothetical protein